MEFEQDVVIPILIGERNGCCDLPPNLRWDVDEAAELANTFKALGHPVRLQIVELLSRFGGQVCVCDIENQFSLKQPTISHHLKILRKAGLIDCEQRGAWIFYFTCNRNLEKLSNLMAEMAQ